MANIVQFYYFQNKDEHNSFLSSNSIDSNALYVIGTEGLLYRGNELIAENSLALIQALNEVNSNQQTQIVNNTNNISSLEGVINEIQAKINTFNGLLDKKVDKEEGKGLSTNDFTTAEKEKLASLQNTIIDSELSETSENPVQNKIITNELNGLRATLNQKVSVNVKGDLLYFT